MVEFRGRVTSVGPSGTFSVGNPEGGAAAFGELVRDDVAARIPLPRDVARAFVRGLRMKGSEWPSTGGTSNRGSVATGVSARSFRAVQGRTGSGRFQSWEIINDARNADGRPYAGLVDSGIYNWRARPSRVRANRRAVERSWRRLGAGILRKLLE